MGLEEFMKMKEHGIRTDCYWAVLGKFQKLYPDAHFECVMRHPYSVGWNNVPPGILSPSASLLTAAKSKTYSMCFATYARNLFLELFGNPKAVERMQFLNILAKKQLVFLVCVEKNPSQCHRSLLKTWMDDLENFIQFYKQEQEKLK